MNIVKTLTGKIPSSSNLVKIYRREHDITFFDRLLDFDRSYYNKAKAVANNLQKKIISLSLELPKGVKLKVKNELAYGGHYYPCGVTRYVDTGILHMKTRLGTAPCTFKKTWEGDAIDYCNNGGLINMLDFLNQPDSKNRIYKNYLLNISKECKDKIKTGRISPTSMDKKLKFMQTFVEQNCPENIGIVFNLREYYEVNKIKSLSARLKARMSNDFDNIFN